MEHFPGKFNLTEESKEAGFNLPDEQLWLPIIGEDGLEVVKTKPQELPLIEPEDEEC